MLPRDRGLFQRLADVFCGHHSHAGAAHVGKDHLTGTGTPQGTGAATVPPDVKAEYLAFNPDATDAEIQKHYNRYMEKQRKE